MYDFTFAGETEITDIFLGFDFVEFVVATHQNDGEMARGVFRDFGTDDSNDLQRAGQWLFQESGDILAGFLSRSRYFLHFPGRCRTGTGRRQCDGGFHIGRVIRFQGINQRIFTRFGNDMEFMGT